ncbi:MAG: hypothetical protein JSS94_10070 [Bacteroidetes bacterium]|nr:hypothetical protein [Bacteroidota bacterium]
MRLSNRQKVPLYNFFNTIIFMILALTITLYILEKLKFNLMGLEENLLLLVPVFLIGFLYLRGKQIFEYDSDGESITIKNRGLIYLLEKPLNDEFPKYKIVNYQIVNAILFKNLYLTINSKKHQKLTLKYNVSYLTKKEINDLKYSLSRIVKENMKIQNSNEI